MPFARPNRVGAPPRYCTEAHRVAATIRKRSDYHTVRMDEARLLRGKRTCEVCGADITHRHPKARFCSGQCRYDAQGHVPREPALSREERLLRRRVRRAAARPAWVSLLCRRCGNTFLVPSDLPGRKPQSCQPCRDLDKPRERTRPRSCKGCGLTIPIGRRALALFCSADCQASANNAAQARRRKVERLEGKPDRECAVCGLAIDVREHGLRSYCGQGCWYRANYTPRPKAGECAWCGGAMSQRRAGARFCGQACRLKAQYERTVGSALRSRPCSHCGQRMPLSTAHRMYCSGRCSRRAYFEANTEKVRAAKRRGNHQRRAMLAQAKRYRVSDRDLLRLWARYEAGCAYCGDRSRALHQEHVVPISRGGVDGIGNLVPACPDCNLAKGDRTLMEWRLGRKSPRYRVPSNRQDSVRLPTRPARVQ